MYVSIVYACIHGAVTQNLSSKIVCKAAILYYKTPGTFFFPNENPTPRRMAEG